MVVVGVVVPIVWGVVISIVVGVVVGIVAVTGGDTNCKISSEFSWGSWEIGASCITVISSWLSLLVVCWLLLFIGG